MLTKAQALDYLDQALGVSVPDFVVAEAVEAVEALEPDLVTQYGELTSNRICRMAVALLACDGGPRRIKSQGAPSGASRSFDNDAKALTLLRRQLAALDTAGLTADLVGTDPAAPPAMLMVVGC